MRWGPIASPGPTTRNPETRVAGKIIESPDGLVDPDVPVRHAAMEAADAHVTAVTKASGSSFYWAMRILPAERRQAMFAIYAFCREVDDIADGEAPAAEKGARLAAWRAEIDGLYRPDPHPVSLTGQALVGPIRAFGLAREDFLAVIDGMEMDVATFIRAPALAELETYCNRVAGAVGLLSIRAFGAGEPAAREFALALGRALQLTNILRDLRADAAMGRLYLPREYLHRHGITSDTPDEVMAHPALPAVCRDLALLARANYEAAEAAHGRCRRGPLRAAVVMMKNYRLILDRLSETGWRDLDAPVRVSKPTRLWIVLRHGLLPGLG